jgi:conjugal transfer pilus assembly protein TraV
MKILTKKLIRKAAIVSTLGIAILTINGCAVLGTEFSCNKIGGIKGCATMDQVNGAVTSGEINTNIEPLDLTQSGEISPSANVPWLTNKSTGYIGDIPSIGQPVRTGDSVQKVVIFPYEDSKGNYHEPAVVYSVLTRSHWIAHPVKSVQTIGQDYE